LKPGEREKVQFKKSVQVKKEKKTKKEKRQLKMKSSGKVVEGVDAEDENGPNDAGKVEDVVNLLDGASLDDDTH
jgi:hypothetical protein